MLLLDFRFYPECKRCWSAARRQLRVCRDIIEQNFFLYFHVFGFYLFISGPLLIASLLIFIMSSKLLWSLAKLNIASKIHPPVYLNLPCNLLTCVLTVAFDFFIVIYTNLTNIWGIPNLFAPISIIVLFILSNTYMKFTNITNISFVTFLIIWLIMWMASADLPCLLLVLSMI